MDLVAGTQCASVKSMIACVRVCVYLRGARAVSFMLLLLFLLMLLVGQQEYALDSIRGRCMHVYIVYI